MTCGCTLTFATYSIPSCPKPAGQDLHDVPVGPDQPDSRLQQRARRSRQPHRGGVAHLGRPPPASDNLIHTQWKQPTHRSVECLSFYRMLSLEPFSRQRRSPWEPRPLSAPTPHQPRRRLEEERFQSYGHTAAVKTDSCGAAGNPLHRLALSPAATRGCVQMRTHTQSPDVSIFHIGPPWAGSMGLP